MRTGRRSSRRPVIESLEDRRLLTGASLAAITNQTVPQQQGLTLPLDGSGTTDAQSFKATSSNPDISASVVGGPFWTVNVQYTDPNNSANNFSGPLVFQLFNNAGSTTLTPDTVKHITQFTNDNYYTQTGKYITRVATGFPGPSDYVIQGGAPNPNGSGNSGQANTPFPNENLQPLAFTGSDQLAMANSGGTNSNDTQFFITTGQPNSELGYNYTIFGQMVPNPTSTGQPSDQTTLGLLTKIPVTTNPNLGNENSLPVNNPIFTSVTLSNSNPSGTLLIDTSHAKAGETANITVTATDPTNGTTVTQTFTVTVGAYAGPTNSPPPAVNFAPFANPTAVTTAQGQSTAVTLSGASGYPDTSTPSTLTYALLSQPTNGTVSNFNPNTGTFTYTPRSSFQGTDTFLYQVTGTGPKSAPSPSLKSNPGTVTITVGPAKPVNTGAVRVVGGVLLITPLPHVGHPKNTIDVIQTPSTATSSTPVIQVFVNGQLDLNQPAVSNLTFIDAFGSKANDKITIDPSVTVPSVIDGGHGGRNVLKGGGTETLMHGWFGYNVMVGGTGPNQMVGRVGSVKFKPSSATDLIFAGQPVRRTALLHARPPMGTFYVYKKGRLVPVPLSALYPQTTPTGGFAPVTPHKHTHKKK